MGLTDIFNKLIVEHGSAVVQEKHLTFFRDQLAAADKKSLILETENAELKATINQLTKDNEELRDKIQIHDQTPQQFERKTANNAVVYFSHKTEPNVFACANCSHDHICYLLPDPNPSSDDILIYFCDKCRKPIEINKTR